MAISIISMEHKSQFAHEAFLCLYFFFIFSALPNFSGTVENVPRWSLQKLLWGIASRLAIWVTKWELINN